MIFRERMGENPHLLLCFRRQRQPLTSRRLWAKDADVKVHPNGRWSFLFMVIIVIFSIYLCEKCFFHKWYVMIWYNGVLYFYNLEYQYHSIYSLLHIFADIVRAFSMLIREYLLFATATTSSFSTIVHRLQDWKFLGWISPKTPCHLSLGRVAEYLNIVYWR